jgi:hypothetical protein
MSHRSRHRHPSIRSFTDSLAAVIGLEARFGRVHAVMLLDEAGRVVDGLALTGSHRSPDEAVAAGALLAASGGSRRVLLLSCGEESVEQIVESTIEAWRRFRRVFADVGVELVDWLASDGESIRSYAITDEGGVVWR